MADLSDEFNLEANIERVAKAKETVEEMREYTEKMTAFIGCCQTKTVQDVDAFIKEHPDLDIHNPRLKGMFFIGREKNWDVIKHLIEKHNCDPHGQNENLLYQAAENGHLDMVKFLVKECGADIHADNDCAFRYACLRERYDVIEFLLEQGADASKFSSEGPWKGARVTCDFVVKSMAEKKRATLQNKIQQTNISKIKNKTRQNSVRRRPKGNAK